MTSCFYGRFRVTSNRGWRNLGGESEYHGGLDIVADDDKTVRAIADGVCYRLTENNGFGTYIRQLLPDGRRIYYGHLSKWLIPNGSRVKKGDAIGIMGSTGRSTGAHTHLEIRVKGTSKVSEDIAKFIGIENKIGQYCYYPTDICINKIAAVCGFAEGTKAYLKAFDDGGEMVNKIYTAMTKSHGVGTKLSAYDCAIKIETTCGLTKKAMSYLWAYRWANDLMQKLWNAMA